MATIKAVQTGTVSFLATDTSKTATITAITTANSVLYLTHSGNNSTQPAQNSVRGAVTNTTTLTFTRTGTGTGFTLQVEFFLVEFTSGVTVQRGSQNLGDAASANVTITTSSLTTSWSVCSWSLDGFGMHQDNFVSHYLSTTTNLAIVRGTTGDYLIVEWQVVTYDNATVQQVSKSLLTTDTTNTSTITSVTTTKTFLEFSYLTGTGAGQNNYCWNSYLTNATTITYSRITASPSATTRDYVISISDAIAVQRGEKALADGTATGTNALTAIVIANSFAHSLNTPGICKNNDTEADNCWNTDMFGVKLKFNSTTQLNFARNNSSWDVTCSWEVVEWPAAVTVAAKPIFNTIWIF